MTGQAGRGDAPDERAGRDAVEDLAVALRPVTATLLALAGIRTGETVADAGCGPGLLTHPAAAGAGPTGRVYGVDPDPAALALARGRRDSAVCWVRGDLARLPFASGSVDKVLCGDVLRLADPAAVVAECARVLVPGGRLAVSAWGDGGEDDLAALLRAGGLAVAHLSADDGAPAAARGRVRYATATAGW